MSQKNSTDALNRTRKVIVNPLTSKVANSLPPGFQRASTLTQESSEEERVGASRPPSPLLGGASRLKPGRATARDTFVPPGDDPDPMLASSTDSESVIEEFTNNPKTPPSVDVTNATQKPTASERVKELSNFSEPFFNLSQDSAKKYTKTYSGKYNDDVLKGLETKLKSLSMPDQVIKMAIDTAIDLTAKKHDLDTLKSIGDTVERNSQGKNPDSVNPTTVVQVYPKSIRLGHQLDVPEKHKNEPSIRKIVQEFNEEKIAYQSSQVSRIVAIKRVEWSIRKKEFRHILLSKLYSISKDLTTHFLYDQAAEDSITFPSKELSNESTFAFHSLAQILMSGPSKTEMTGYTKVSMKDLYQELINFSRKIDPTDPPSTQTSYYQMCRSSEFSKKVLVKTVEKLQDITAEITFKHQTSYNRFLGHCKATAACKARKHNTHVYTATEATQKVLDRTTAQGNKNKTASAAIDSAVKKSLTSEKKKAEAAKKKAKAKASPNLKDKGGQKAPRSDPTKGNNNKKQKEKEKTPVSRANQKGKRKMPTESKNENKKDKKSEEKSPKRKRRNRKGKGQDESNREKK